MALRGAALVNAYVHKEFDGKFYEGIVESYSEETGCAARALFPAAFCARVHARALRPPFPPVPTLQLQI